MNRQGFTLIEIAIVLTIVGLLIGGVWTVAATVINSNKKAELSREVIQIIQNSKNICGNVPTANMTAGLTNTQAVPMGIYPSNMLMGSNVRHPFATVATDSVSIVGTGSGFTLFFGLGIPGTGLPSDACVDIISRLTTLNNFNNYNITGVSGSGGTAWDITNISMVTMSAIAANCPNPGSTNSVFVFYNC